MKKIKVIEKKELQATVSKRHRSYGVICEVIVNFRYPDGTQGRASKCTNIVWDGSEACIKTAKAKYEAQLIQEALDKLEGREAIEEPKPRKIPMAQYIQEWYDYQHDVLLKVEAKSITSVRNDKFAVSLIKPYFINHPVMVQNITQKDIYGYVLYLKNKGYDNNYIAVKLSYISRILNCAKEEGLIRKNPCREIKLRKDPKNDKPILTAAQLRLLLETVKGDPAEPVIYVLVFLGCRFGEALALKWEAIDMMNNYIYLKKKSISGVKKEEQYSDRLKSDQSYRKLKIHPVFKDYLSNLKGKQEADKVFFGAKYNDNGFVFCRHDGKDMTPDAWRRRLQKFMHHQHVVPYVKPQDIRRSYNTIQREADVADFIAARNMGHTPKVNNEYYTKVRDELADQAVLTVGDMIEGKGLT